VRDGDRARARAVGEAEVGLVALRRGGAREDPGGVDDEGLLALWKAGLEIACTPSPDADKCND
jgi:hypothetical protein